MIGNAESASPVRLAQLLCDAHQTMRWWPIADDEDALINSCGGCQDRTERTIGQERVYVPYLPDLSDRRVVHFNATHESAHAVTGLAAGGRIQRISVVPSSNRGPDYVGVPAGRVEWALDQIPVLDVIASHWAGQVAGLRWLGTFGYDTLENRIDCYSGARGDVANIKAVSTGEPLSAWGLELADLLVERYWDTIMRLADHLSTMLVLDASEVAELTGFGLTR